jgi:hypothetical protein
VVYWVVHMLEPWGGFFEHVLTLAVLQQWLSSQEPCRKASARCNNAMCRAWQYLTAAAYVARYQIKHHVCYLPPTCCGLFHAC